MKKLISLALAVLMVMAMIPTALAANTPGPCRTCGGVFEDCEYCGYFRCTNPECENNAHDCRTAHTQGTKVEYTAAGSEAYTITVPAQLAPSGSGTVTLSGTWATDRKVTVTADKTVTLVNSINAADTKTLDVTFAGISKAGDNTQAKTYTEAVSVAAMPADALFGTWSGKFNYNVEVGAAVEMITFTVNDVGPNYEAMEFQAEAGMTWKEWALSDYNTSGNIYYTMYVDGRGWLTFDGQDVVSSDLIVANGIYSIRDDIEF